MPKIATLALLALTLASAVLRIPTAVTLAAPPLAALALIGYRRLLARRPYANCRPCRGTGYRRSALFAAWNGQCPTCTGTGRRPRTGTRLLNIR